MNLPYRLRDLNNESTFAVQRNLDALVNYIDQLKQRIEELEAIVEDHETRITTLEP